MSVTVVIPCYNEAERLDFDEMGQFLKIPNRQILFVDDCSSDATPDLIRTFCAKHQGASSVLRLERNSGKAEAVRQGMLQALDGRATYAAYWDADLAAPLDALDEMIGAMQADERLIAVFGSRVRMLGFEIERRAARHYLGRVFATVVSIILGVPVYDTQCGAKAFRAGQTVGTAFGMPFVSRWIFDVEVLSRLMQQPGIGRGNLHQFVTEYPLRVWRDVPGSKLNVGSYFRAAVDLARIWRARPR